MEILAQQTSLNEMLSIFVATGAMIVGLSLLTWRWFKLALKENAKAIEKSSNAVNKRIDDTNNNLASLRADLHQGLTHMSNSLTLFRSAGISHQGVVQPHMDANYRGRLP